MCFIDVKKKVFWRAVRGTALALSLIPCSLHARGFLSAFNEE
jgi:hypothetical protein